jgi:hypothetical protein
MLFGNLVGFEILAIVFFFFLMFIYNLLMRSILLSLH